MHSFFECQWKLHAFIVGRPAVESQYCILSYSLLKILWLEKHYFLESSYTTDKTIRPLKSYLRLSLTLWRLFRKHLKSRCLKLCMQHHILATKQWGCFYMMYNYAFYCFGASTFPKSKPFLFISFEHWFSDLTYPI